MSMPDLIVDNVTRRFSTRSDPLVVLRGCSLQMSTGENLAIVGPSGSGKSTLLYIIGTLDRPTSGSVRLGGEDPFSGDEPRLAAFRNEPHRIRVSRSSPAAAMLGAGKRACAALAAGGVTAELTARARDLLSRVGLGDRLDHRPAELSPRRAPAGRGGAGFIAPPSPALADEPTGNLDRTNAALVGDLLLELQRQEGTMLIVVTHSGELAPALQQAMRAGRRLSEGAIDSQRRTQATNASK